MKTTTHIPDTIIELDPAPRPATAVQRSIGPLPPTVVSYRVLIEAGAPSGVTRINDINMLVTSDLIAAVLRAEGITGHRSDLSSCALANWASKIVGPCEVNEKGMSFTFTQPAGNTVEVNVPASSAMCEFVQKFDSDGYPDLVA